MPHCWAAQWLRQRVWLRPCLRPSNGATAIAAVRQSGDPLSSKKQHLSALAGQATALLCGPLNYWPGMCKTAENWCTGIREGEAYRQGKQYRAEMHVQGRGERAHVRCEE